MTPEELVEQGRAIDALNADFESIGDPFRVLRSMEVDLFSDGSLDMDEASLAGLDLVLGAFHSKLRSTADETDRYVAALRQPRLHVLAHPKARMYGRRVGLVADWPRVFGEAARLGTALELDATVWRQDLDVELATLARAEGVRWFSIGSDAHSAAELEFLPFGMAIAKRAGIPREQILNYRSVDFVRSWAAARADPSRMTRGTHGARILAEPDRAPSRRCGFRRMRSSPVPQAPPRLRPVLAHGRPARRRAGCRDRGQSRSGGRVATGRQSPRRRSAKQPTSRGAMRVDRRRDASLVSTSSGSVRRLEGTPRSSLSASERIRASQNAMWPNTAATVQSSFTGNRSSSSLSRSTSARRRSRSRVFSAT
jgi:histidinol phosphatase-like PHP family hydrolase